MNIVIFIFGFALGYTVRTIYQLFWNHKLIKQIDEIRGIVRGSRIIKE